MKPTLFLPLILICTVVFSSCVKLTKTTTFNLTISRDFTIPSTTTINLPFNIISPDIQTQSSSTFETNNTRADLVDKITLRSLAVTITSPSSGTFNFLKSVQLKLSANGLPDTVIAWKDNIPNDNVQSMDLTVSGVNLQSYLVQDKITLSLLSTTDELITSNYELHTQSVFGVEARLLK